MQCSDAPPPPRHFLLTHSEGIVTHQITLIGSARNTRYLCPSTNLPPPTGQAILYIVHLFPEDIVCAHQTHRG